MLLGSLRDHSGKPFLLSFAAFARFFQLYLAYFVGEGLLWGQESCNIARPRASSSLILLRAWLESGGLMGKRGANIRSSAITPAVKRPTGSATHPQSGIHTAEN